LTEERGEGSLSRASAKENSWRTRQQQIKFDVSATALVNPNGLDLQLLGNLIRAMKFWDVRILMALLPKAGTVTVAHLLVLMLAVTTSFSGFELLLSLAQL
jgi:hypothetical protein